MNEKQLVSELRPKKLDEFVGNAGIKKIVKKNLEKGYFSHLTIFSGANGVGKSSMAEYIAQALVCERVGMEVVTPSGEIVRVSDPCGECEKCKLATRSNFEAGSAKKFNMAILCNKREVLDVLKEIFVFEGAGKKNVYVLEEFQSLNKKDQEVFLEWLTRVPEDVYVFICTDKMAGIIPAIRNRFTEIPLEKPTVSEAVEFLYRCAERAGVKIQSKEVAKMFTKANNANPRAMVTNLELFRAVGVMEEVSVRHLFRVDNDLVDKLWANLFDKDVSLDEFMKLLLGIAEESDVKRIYKDLQLKSVVNLVESKVHCENSDTTTVEKGRRNKIIGGCGKFYGKILDVLKECPEDETGVLNVLARAKLVLQVNAIPEQNNLGTAKARSATASSYSSKYGK